MFLTCEDFTPGWSQNSTVIKIFSITFFCMTFHTKWDCLNQLNYFKFLTSEDLTPVLILNESKFLKIFFYLTCTKTDKICLDFIWFILTLEYSTYGFIFRKNSPDYTTLTLYTFRVALSDFWLPFYGNKILNKVAVFKKFWNLIEKPET